MNKLTLHIGLHKTGTTFLQRQYFPYFEDTHYFNKNLAFQNLAYKRNRNFFISNETLSGRPWNEEWKRGIKNSFSWLESFEMATDNMQQLFPDAHIVVVFRKQGDLLISLYKQYIQEGGELNFQNFYNENGVLKEKDLALKPRLDILNEKFSRVSVLSFEEFKSEGVEYFDKFFNSIGYSRRDFGNVKRENSSISGRKIELLRGVNKHYRKAPKRLKDVLAFAKLTPRKILQKRLNTWNPKDPEEFNEIKLQVNSQLQHDWEKVKEYFWVEGRT